MNFFSSIFNPFRPKEECPKHVEPNVAGIQAEKPKRKRIPGNQIKKRKQVSGKEEMLEKKIKTMQEVWEII